MIVRLSPGECRAAAYVGINRRLDSMRNQRPEVHGAAAGGDYWTIDVEAAGAELAVAKALGVHWTGLDGPDKDVGDVAGAQVRHSRRQDASLILHERDADDDRFVLVTGALPDMTVRGWCWGREGKRPHHWRTSVPRPAYFVPQSALRRMEARGEDVL